MQILINNIKRFLLILLLTLSFGIFAQTSIEGGLNTGGLYYLGEINLKKPFKSTTLGLGVFLRYNLNLRWSVKLSTVVGTLSGNDENSSSLYQLVRSHKFKTRIVDIVPEMEFNFFPYKIGKKQFTEKYTPYFATGLGVAFLLHTHRVVVVWPITLGLKYQINNKMEVGVSTSFRRTFTDRLDEIEENVYVKPPKKNGEPFKNENFRYKQRGLKYNKDWYIYTGVFLTYKIFQRRTACKAYDF